MKKVLSLAARIFHGIVTEQEINSTQYLFSEVELPSGSKISLGIEDGDYLYSVRDFASLRDLKLFIENDLIKIAKLKDDTNVMFVESEMRVNGKKIAICKPFAGPVADFSIMPRLSNEDIKFLFETFAP